MSVCMPHCVCVCVSSCASGLAGQCRAILSLGLNVAGVVCVYAFMYVCLYALLCVCLCVCVAVLEGSLMECRASLVIAPSHLTRQWQLEVETNCPSLRVIVITTKCQHERVLHFKSVYSPRVLGNCSVMVLGA